LFTDLNSRIGRPELDALLMSANDPVNPTQLPIELARMLVRNCSTPGSFVADLFGGTGTVSIAALCEGRSACWLDFDETQLEHTRSRVLEMQRLEDLIAKASTVSLATGSAAPSAEAVEAAAQLELGTLRQSDHCDISEVLTKLQNPDLQLVFQFRAKAYFNSGAGDMEACTAMAQEELAGALCLETRTFLEQSVWSKPPDQLSAFLLSVLSNHDGVMKKFKQWKESSPMNVSCFSNNP
jgi:hypothetical protein